MNDNDLRTVFVGIPAAPGVAQAPLFVQWTGRLRAPRSQITDPGVEIERLAKARQTAMQEIEALKAKVLSEIGPAEADVFDAHAMLLEDEELVGLAEAAIMKYQNAEAAWEAAIEQCASELQALPDATFQQRAADVRDIGQRVLCHLLGQPYEDSIVLHEPSIIVAVDLTPSQTSQLDRTLVMGFCTALGGPTSHSAILAKALGIPAVVGLGEGVMALKAGLPAIVDGQSGQLVVAPNAEDEALFRQKESAELKTKKRYLALAKENCFTSDGWRVEVVANIGGLEDAQLAVENGAEGVGLFRTEFLFLDRHTEPTEAEQYQAYRVALAELGERPVVVRTLDAGGDKAIPYLNVKPEANPFLGWRAVRICLHYKELFKRQLRALLRAGVGHDLRIMFPMVAALAEVYEARALLDECKEELLNEGQPFNESPQIGIMAEIPSVCLMAEMFAPEVDFFSVGTNDLTQYTFAAERTNEKVAHLADACHPAIFRQIRALVQAAHKQGRWVGVCGELAGDFDAIPILVGLGVDELSMSPYLIPKAKAVIRNLTVERAHQLAERTLRLPDANSVRNEIKQLAGSLV